MPCRSPGSWCGASKSGFFLLLTSIAGFVSGWRRGELDAKLSEIEALNVDQQTLEQKYNSFKEMLAPFLILEPTLVGSGETTMAFDGNLGIVLYEASDTSKCHKDSVAVSYLINGTDKKKLCLRTGKPESFKYQGKKYLLNLLESKKARDAPLLHFYSQRAVS